MLTVPYFRQNRDYTCGPVCLRMVLAYWGYETDEVSLSMLCKTNIFGTAADQLVEVARRFEFDGYAERKSKHLYLTRALKESVPPIVAVDATILYEKQQSIYAKHDIVLLEITSRKVVYHDPAGSESTYIAGHIQRGLAAYPK